MRKKDCCTESATCSEQRDRKRSDADKNCDARRGRRLETFIHTCINANAENERTPVCDCNPI